MFRPKSRPCLLQSRMGKEQDAKIEDKERFVLENKREKRYDKPVLKNTKGYAAMSKKMIVVVLIFVVLLSVLSGCSQKEEKPTAESDYQGAVALLQEGRYAEASATSR